VPSSVAESGMAKTRGGNNCRNAVRYHVKEKSRDSHFATFCSLGDGGEGMGRGGDYHLGCKNSPSVVSSLSTSRSCFANKKEIKVEKRTDKFCRGGEQTSKTLNVASGQSQEKVI